MDFDISKSTDNANYILIESRPLEKSIKHTMALDCLSHKINIDFYEGDAPDDLRVTGIEIIPMYKGNI